ncbi:MAG: DUF2497 domain-containing protein [Alphaproteobacteria bacterium]|nr:DUF2497 domain-containing protein [Alphaproteobacteria bacterium]
MSNEANTDQDPSIEEILDSIRQIISEDDDEEAVIEEEKKQETEVEPEPEEPMNQSAIDDIDFDAPAEEEEVLELTERVDEEGLQVDMVDNEEEEVEVAPEPPPAPKQPAAPPPPAPPSGGDDSILSKKAEEAAFEAISELARKTAVEFKGVTLEEIVRNEIRPLLRGWMDDHLESVIERLVKEELERVSKRVLEG